MTTHDTHSTFVTDEEIARLQRRFGELRLEGGRWFLWKLSVHEHDYFDETEDRNGNPEPGRHVEISHMIIPDELSLVIGRAHGQLLFHDRLQGVNDRTHEIDDVEDALDHFEEIIEHQHRENERLLRLDAEHRAPPDCNINHHR